MNGLYEEYAKWGNAIEMTSRMATRKMITNRNIKNKIYKKAKSEKGEQIGYKQRNLYA